ncbi:DNA-binding transcriptional activator FucR [compost metagenome]
MRADRLISILLLLQNHRRLTTRELAARLEVSERTIHRDMEALSASGVPVYAERGSGGGWALSEGYRTDLTGMKPEEMQALLLAHSSSLLGDLGLGSVFEDAFQKMLAAFPERLRGEAERVRQRIHIDGAGWHQSVDRLPDLPTIQEAVWQERMLRFDYRREDSAVERIAEPLGLVAKSSIWYLVARVEGEMRTYRISRIRNAKVLEESFQRPESFDLAQYWERSTEQFKANLPRYPAQLRVQEAALPRLAQQRYLKLVHTMPAEQGWIEADAEFNTLESACEILLGYGSLVKVLEPLELRDRVRAEATAIIAMYNG